MLTVYTKYNDNDDLMELLYILQIVIMYIIGCLLYR